MKILITGGLGYIGYFTVKELKKNITNDITIIDNFSNNQHLKYFEKFKIKIINSDYCSKKILQKIFKQKIDIVIHLASFKKVQESLARPEKYHFNNVVKTKRLVETCISNGVKKIIFASSASVYGKQNKVRVKENFSTSPMSPYAKNKIDIENYLKNIAKQKKIKFVILRYFNIAGSDINKGSINLIKINNFIHKSIKYLENGRKIPIYGGNYKTKDGTTLRDYIHVEDIAKINSRITSNFNLFQNDIFNVGSGKGNTLLDVLKKFKNNNLKTIMYPKKRGDIEAIIADNSKIKKYLNFKNFLSVAKILDSLK